MEKTIVLVGTLDTKGQEVGFVRDRIRRRGYQVIVVDAGVLGSPLIEPDISREQVAKAGGTQIEDLVTSGEEGKAIEPMIRGVAEKVQELHRSGKLDGILSLGGSIGTAIGTAAMRALPLGIPKVMVTTMAATETGAYLGTKDITIIPSLTDIAGLNRMTTRLLATAAGAIMGMVAEDPGSQPSDRPVIAISARGGVTPCLNVARSLLEERGYEVVVFHAVGSGGRALEESVEQGVIDGVLELCLSELADRQFGGIFDPGPNRLEAAGRKGIPQVVAPGKVGTMAFNPAQVPHHLMNRRHHEHIPGLVTIQADKEEMAMIAGVVAEKLNRAIGPTAVVIPLRGFVPFDREGRTFYDPEADKAFRDTLKKGLNSRVIFTEIDANINDRSFAEEAANLLCRLMHEVDK